ncbi:MAG: type II secretion system protein M [Candidatus Competibacter sp.]|nr:type II secretion system protein M [Candidatus Competibacter sp.]MDG4585339.1 type II secretion system protein M [Candidatus Competibacter sp.]
MKAWWEALSTRERLWVVGGLGVLLLLLCYAQVWKPFWTSHRQLQQRTAEQRADLIWMRQAAREVKRLSAAAGAHPASDGRSLLTLVDQTARTAGLASTLKRVAPQGEDKLSAQLDAVEFDKLIPWLGMLEYDHRLAIVSLSVDRTDAAGLVNARVILQGVRP